jgi:thioredoxin reductase (NADPH)
MLAVLEDLRGEHGFAIELRDIDTRPDWRERYDRLVPVLMCGDEEVCRYFPDIAKVREVLGRFR